MGIIFYRTEYETSYAPDTDITFVLKNYYNLDREIKKTELFGFYHGMPNDAYTEELKSQKPEDRLIAHY